MKKLGIIAGMGPFASTSFIRQILRLTPAPKEWDHIRMLVDYNISIPSRTRALLYGEASPSQEMVQTIHGLEKSGADLLALPCNSAHYWYEEVSSQINIPWLNIIETTANAVKREKVKSVLIVGAYVTVSTKLYDKYLSNTVYLNESEMEELYKVIEGLKLDQNKETLKAAFHNIVKPYKNKVDGIVLACTEPSMLFDDRQAYWESFHLIDSTYEYAKRCVEICKGVHL